MSEKLDSAAINAVLDEILEERVRQHGLWGTQSHKNGTARQGSRDKASPTREWGDKELLEEVRKGVKKAEQSGALTWRHILTEEVVEAFAERSDKNLRTELVQVAAVCCAWVECIDRRAAEKASSKGAPSEAQDCPSGQCLEP